MRSLKVRIRVKPDSGCFPAARVTGVPESHVMVVLEDGPARSAVEGGRVLPEPGAEQEWLARRGEV
ncbi:hypothetical protein [Streptomyces sp. NPDC054804]